MKKFVKYLKNLKKFNVVAIKQSLEDEGASFEEIKLMRRITKSAGLQHNIGPQGLQSVILQLIIGPEDP